MPKSPIFGRRIHITGSITPDTGQASTTEIAEARELVKGLVIELIKRGATFVLPVDAEKLRPVDNLPICFDWLIWQTIHANLAHRPTGAVTPFVVAVQHHKTEKQIPHEFEPLWDDLRTSDLVQIENVSHWDMNSKRMEAQARHGDILIALGGSEGVMFLANVYHDAGKPVVPLNLAITPEHTGARRLFDLGLSRGQAQRLFRSTEQNAHAWINRINFSNRTSTPERVEAILKLLEALEKPRAFVVRLLDTSIPEYLEVQKFFDEIVKPIVENELGFNLVVVDGRQQYEHARIDQEIFAKLHRSSVVLADLTGLRPNCFLELGYALGRCLPTMVMMKEGSSRPFDIYTLAGLHWKTTGSIEERQQTFRDHWNAVRNRPQLVSSLPLIE